MTDTALKQPFPHRIQRHFIGLNDFDLDVRPRPVCQPVQLSRGIPRLFEGQQAGFQAVAVHADGDLRSSLHQIVKDRQILPGKVRKAVYVEHVLLSIASILQLFQQPGHLVTGVPFSPLAQTVVSIHQQGKLLQLLGKASLRLAGSVHQILRSYAAALEFIHRVNEPRQEFRLGLHGGIRLQPAGELSGGCRHGDHPSAAVQALHGRASHGIRHPSCQSGKGQHLRVPAGSIPGRSTQSALRLMADQLRNDQNSVPLSIPDIPGNPV